MKRSRVKFVDQNLENSFNSLSEKDPIKRGIKRAIGFIKEDAFCGRNVRKRLIPKKLVEKYKINNLWIYNLPNG